MIGERSGQLERALLDAVVDAYIDWREESAAVELAHRRWNEAPPDERPLAFAAFGAALDREERAAVLYGDMVGVAATTKARRS